MNTLIMRHGFDISSLVAISGLIHTGLGMSDASYSVATQTSDIFHESPSAHSVPAFAAQESSESAWREEGQSYLPRQSIGPSVTLRVVDEVGRATEVPVDFADARIEPRGFWGDVAVNGMALFFASVCIILVKEFFTWGAMRRQKAQAAAQRSIMAHRRAAISEQLETIEVGLREIRAQSREGKDEDLEDSAIRFVGLLDGYRDEIKEYDAPALLAYVDSLIAQITQVLRKRSTTREPQDASNNVYRKIANITEVSAFSQQVQQAPRSPMAPPPNPPQAEAISSIAGSHNPDVHLPYNHTVGDRDRASAEDNVLSMTKQGRAFAPEAHAQQVQQETQAQAEMPDIDLVHRIMVENPGMHPSKVIKVAAGITMNQKQRLMRSSP